MTIRPGRVFNLVRDVLAAHDFLERQEIKSSEWAAASEVLDMLRSTATKEGHNYEPASPLADYKSASDARVGLASIKQDLLSACVERNINPTPLFIWIQSVWELVSAGVQMQVIDQRKPYKYPPVLCLSYTRDSGQLINVTPLHPPYDHIRAIGGTAQHLRAQIDNIKARIVNRAHYATAKGIERAKAEPDFEIQQAFYEGHMEYLHELRSFFVKEALRYLPDVPISALKDFGLGWLKGFAPPDWEKFIPELEMIEFEANREAVKILNTLGSEPNTDVPGASSLPSMQLLMLRPRGVVYQPPSVDKIPPNTSGRKRNPIRPAKKKKPKPGRPSLTRQQMADYRKWAKGWKKRAAGETKKDYCRRISISVKQLNAALQYSRRH